MASDRPPFCVETIPGLWEIEPSCLVWSIKFTVDIFATELQDPCGISLERYYGVGYLYVTGMTIRVVDLLSDVILIQLSN